MIFGFGSHINDDDRVLREPPPAGRPGARARGPRAVKLKGYVRRNSNPVLNPVLFCSIHFVLTRNRPLQDRVAGAIILNAMYDPVTR